MNRAKIFSAIALSSINCVARPTKSAANNAQQLTGAAYLIAPIAGAHVIVAKAATGKTDQSIAEGTTDDKGAFQITLPDNTDGDLLVSVVGDRGGSTIEPITGVAPITLSQNDTLTALALGTHLGDKTNVIINPLTTLVTARALVEFRKGTSLASAAQENISLFSAHLDTASPWESPPIDLMQTAAPGLSSGVVYSLASLALSKEALELGERAGVTDVSISNSLVLLRALVQDLQDGTFDGTNAGTPLNIVGNVFIDTETTRLSLAQALDDFLESDANSTGLSDLDVSQVTNAIRQDTSGLYPPSNGPPQPTDPTGASGAGPAITIISPTNNQTLGNGNQLVGNAFDVDGIAALTITIDGTDVAPTFDTTSATKWLWAFTPTLADGPHVLQVSATDTKSNATSQQISFSFDNTGPAVSVVSCVAPDDRLRVATVTGAGATYAATTSDSGCVEADLQSGAQNFYTFADLFDAGSIAPSINLSVTDPSGVASVNYQVRVNGNVTGNSAALATAAAPSTNVLGINAQVLGVSAGSVHAGDTYAVDVIAIDQFGNKTTRTFSFHLSLVPTPLYVVDSTPDSSVALTAYTFAAGNVDQLFAQSFDSTKPCGSYFCQAFPNSIVDVSRFVVTDVSPRPITLQTDWATATTGSMNLARQVLRTYFYSNQAFARNPSGPCAEITDVVASGEFDTEGGYFPAWTPNWSTQSCRSLDADFMLGNQSQNLSFTPVIRVFQLPANTLQTGSTVTLQPGVQYAVAIGLYNLSIPSTNIGNSWPNEPSIGNDPGYTIGNTTARSPLAFESNYPNSNGGFWQFNQFINANDTSWYSAWGLADYFYASDDFNDTSGTDVRAIYVSADGQNHLMSPVILEHGLHFTSNVSWNATVAMSAVDPVFVGTGDHQPLATLAPFTTAPSKPNLCPWANPLCNVDLSAW